MKVEKCISINSDCSNLWRDVHFSVYEYVALAAKDVFIEILEVCFGSKNFGNM
jgi:hypothetical protein